MKKKFTLHVADLQISVVTDATAEEVERIRGILDRKMREIYLKSRCPKTEAALLCALEFAADRMEQQTKLAELTDRCEKYEVITENLEERLAAETEEVERLRQENEILRSLVGGEKTAPDPISPTAFLAEVAEAQNTPAAPAPVEREGEALTIDDMFAEVEARAEEEILAEETARSRSRVGSMFDLLSFGETD